MPSGAEPGRHCGLSTPSASLLALGPLIGSLAGLIWVRSREVVCPSQRSPDVTRLGRPLGHEQRSQRHDAQR
jgi:hypothetical protein